MAQRLFGPEDRARILQNGNVLRVGETMITYSPAFKIAAVRENLVEKKPPHLIFRDAGFDLDPLGRKTLRNAWRGGERSSRSMARRVEARAKWKEHHGAATQ